MRLFRLLLLVFLFNLTTKLEAQEATEVKPEPPPLLTKWGKTVSKNNPLPEYPRPQMARKDWQSLNGEWQFEEVVPGPLPRGRDLASKVLVPFPIESPLSGVGKHFERVWYRRMFQVPAAWKEQNILLNFGAVSWESGVYLNGKLVGTHKGSYDPFSFDITEFVREGDNELLVGAINKADWDEYPRGKQANRPENTSHTAATGIWQTVWLEPVPKTRIENLIITPEVETGNLTVKVEAVNSEGDMAQVEVFDGANRVATGRGVANTNIKLVVPNPKLWSPESPFLYDLKVTLLRDNKAIDSVNSYCAFRSIALGFDEKNRRRILLNGKFVFQVGVMDQGYWPDGVYTAPSDEALRFDIETAKKLGFNMIRKRAKIEPARWYYWADKLGILVWQDMPGASSSSAKGKKQFEVELRRLVETRRHHPSIVQWVLFHDGWGLFDGPRLTQLVKTLDPTRLVLTTSGARDEGVGDVIAPHRHPEPEPRAPEATRASATGEFGGLSHFVPGHSWSSEFKGQRQIENPAILARTYEKLMADAWKYRDEPGVSAVVYLQLTDVENENNGFLTYDRAVMKVADERIRKANSGSGEVKPLAMLLPTAKDAPATWKYTLENPGEEWMKPEFNDAAWQTGEAGFGSKDMSGVKTEWKTPRIWLRREIELADKPKTPLFLIRHDDDFEIYVNGVLAAQGKSSRPDYGEYSLTKDAEAAFKPGKNIIAVHARNTGGLQFIDLGLGQVE